MLSRCFQTPAKAERLFTWTASPSGAHIIPRGLTRTALPWECVSLWLDREGCPTPGDLRGKDQMVGGLSSSVSFCFESGPAALGSECFRGRCWGLSILERRPHGYVVLIFSRILYNYIYIYICLWVWVVCPPSDDFLNSAQNASSRDRVIPSDLWRHLTEQFVVSSRVCLWFHQRFPVNPSPTLNWIRANSHIRSVLWRKYRSHGGHKSQCVMHELNRYISDL